MLGEFIQHISDTVHPVTAVANVLATWDAKFDTIAMTNAEVQNWMFRYLFKRPELFKGDTSDVAANREALRIVVSGHIPAFLKQANTLPSPAAVQEYFEASR